ncbi:MAG TPA: hypothetical protein VFC56_15415 [Stellaceae bacterium]|nr:hypothetical protein [Stellaceae bacterium]
MERFDDSLKTTRRARLQKLVAIVANTPLTEVPTCTMTLNAAIEMKNAIIAYSIAVAPRRRALIHCRRERIIRFVPIYRSVHDDKRFVDDWLSHWPITRWSLAESQIGGARSPQRSGLCIAEDRTRKKRRWWKEAPDWIDRGAGAADGMILAAYRA